MNDAFRADTTAASRSAGLQACQRPPGSPEALRCRNVCKCLLLIALLAPLAMAARSHLLAQSTRIDPALYGGLRWRNIGPFRGGRVNGVSGVPGQPNTFYFGPGRGGAWKTTNAGRPAPPGFDPQPIASVRAIGVAPPNPPLPHPG